jgi:hypothetical protein
MTTPLPLPRATVPSRHRAILLRVIKHHRGGALTHRLDLLCGLRIGILASLDAALRAMRLGQVVQICHTRWECAVVRPVFARDHD